MAELEAHQCRNKLNQWVKVDVGDKKDLPDETVKFLIYGL